MSCKLTKMMTNGSKMGKPISSKKIGEKMTADEKCQPNFGRGKADFQCNSADVKVES